MKTGHIKPQCKAHFAHTSSSVLFEIVRHSLFYPFLLLGKPPGLCLAIDFKKKCIYVSHIHQIPRSPWIHDPCSTSTGVGMQTPCPEVDEVCGISMELNMTRPKKRFYGGINRTSDNCLIIELLTGNN